MQTNDILILGNTKFLIKKQAKINKAGFSIKLTQILSPISLLTFNSCIIIINEKCFYMSQKSIKFF